MKTGNCLGASFAFPPCCATSPASKAGAAKPQAPLTGERWQSRRRLHPHPWAGTSSFCRLGSGGLGSGSLLALFMVAARHPCASRALRGAPGLRWWRAGAPRRRPPAGGGERGQRAALAPGPPPAASAACRGFSPSGGARPRAGRGGTESGRRLRRLRRGRRRGASGGEGTRREKSPEPCLRAWRCLAGKETPSLGALLPATAWEGTRGRRRGGDDREGEERTPLGKPLARPRQ